MTTSKSAAIPRARARVGGKVSALRRRYQKVARGEELTHLAHLLLLRDDLLADYAAGHLEVQRMRLLSETNRQIESCGSRLGIWSPAPLAGEAATPLQEEYPDDLSDLSPEVRRIITGRDD